MPQTHETTPRLIGMGEVMRRVPRSRATIYRWEKLGIFPHRARKPAGSTSALWLADEVDEFVEGVRNSSAPTPKLPINQEQKKQKAGVRQPAMPSKKQLHGAAADAEKRNRPHLFQSHLDKNDNESCLVVQPIPAGSQTIYFDPKTGRLFAVIGQLPAAEPK